MTVTSGTRRRTFSGRLAVCAWSIAALVATNYVAVPALAAAANPAMSSPRPTASSPGSQLASPQNHRIVHHDAPGDVVLFSEESQATTPAPHERTTDIIDTVVDHRTRRVVVSTHVRQLSRSEHRFMVSEILTSEGQRLELTVDYSTTPIGRRVSLQKLASGAEVSCGGASWSITPSSDRISATIPNACLGDPEWVRLGIALVSAPSDLDTSWADDSRSRGHVGDQHLELGPRQFQA